MFGHNDSRDKDWDEKLFKKDYVEMINSLLKMGSKPSIYLMIPPPVYEDGCFLGIRQQVVKQQKRIVPEIAKEAGLPAENVIDLYHAMGGDDLTEQALFCDA